MSTKKIPPDPPAGDAPAARPLLPIIWVTGQRGRSATFVGTDVPLGRHPAKAAARSLHLVSEQVDADRRDIALVVAPDGAIDLSGCDAGPLAEEMLGDWNYEFGVRLDPEAVRQLCLRLRGELPEDPAGWVGRVLATMYRGDGAAVTRLAALCALLGVPYGRWGY